MEVKNSMSIRTKSILSFLLFFMANAHGSSFSSIENCGHFFETQEISRSIKKVDISRSGIDESEISAYVSKKITDVLEFEYIRKLAEEMGIRVWLFGGTASSFIHYVKWDLASVRGFLNLQRNRFDYDFTHIFRSTQDIDIVVDASPEVAVQFQNTIASRFPHFLGDKANQWEVRTLRYQVGIPGGVGYKEALLNDSNFHNQNTDSNSVGMVEVTIPPQGEPVVRDLKSWGRKKSIFLDDVLNNRITFIKSDQHFKTSRAIAGENPEILSVLRILVKAFQYDLEIAESSLNAMREIINRFNPFNIKNDVARKRIQETAKKLVLHAVNLEFAMNTLDDMGLRQKLISMGNIKQKENFAWWLNREPLRSKKIGQGTYGQTAGELGIHIVSHETNSFLASESISRAHSGEPNVLISRQSAPGEAASYGDGFYTTLGRISVRGTGLTIRFTVDPNAREGVDFTVYQDNVIFKNKKVLKVIPESLLITLDDVLKIAESRYDFEIHSSDLRLLQMHRRRLSSAKVLKEVDLLLDDNHEESIEKLIRILNAIHQVSVSSLVTDEVRLVVAKNIFDRLQRFKSSSNQFEQIQYIKLMGPIIKTLDEEGFFDRAQFKEHLIRVAHSLNAGFELRKEAVFEIFLSGFGFENWIDLKKIFSEKENEKISEEISRWYQSPDLRRKKFLSELIQKWGEAIERAEVSRTLIPLINTGLLNINFKNLAQMSILQLASYYKQKNVLNWLIESSEFDFNARNSRGFTEVEQLMLSGNGDWADQIQSLRPEVKTRSFHLSERDQDKISREYPRGSPVIDFVKIEPGTFLMGEKKKVFTTITEPFEIMSVDMTQKKYQLLGEYLIRKFGEKYGSIRLTPSNPHFLGDELPVNGLYYSEILLWIRGLNELSQLEDFQIQEMLTSMFPGHRKGAQYDLPTEAQWEWVSRLGGKAEREYSFGKNSFGISDYSVYYEQTQSKLLSVGSKKPVFYQGKPLYDLHGLVWRWVSDWYEKRVSGGVDPVGPSRGVFRVIRGGSYISNFSEITSASRFYCRPDEINFYVGFRLIRK